MDVCIDTSKGERERDSVCDDWACWELILYKKIAGNVLRTSSTVMDSVGRTLMNAKTGFFFFGLIWSNQHPAFWCGLSICINLSESRLLQIATLTTAVLYVHIHGLYVQTVLKEVGNLFAMYFAGENLQTFSVHMLYARIPRITYFQ